MQQKGFAALYILISLVILGLIGTAYYFGISKNIPSPATPKACTQEAKLCPDGSAVGRTGPNCEFAQCPSVTPTKSADETANWKTYQQAAAHFSVNFPQSWTMNENLNNQKPYQVELNGAEGKIIITWESGFGGGCPQGEEQEGISTGWEPVRINGETLQGCHFIGKNGIEIWSMMGKQFSDTTVDIKAGVNSPYQNNRNVIFKILSTFKFLN